MNNGDKGFFLLKQINKENILTGLLAVLVLVTVLLPIRDLDQITTLGSEIQYWGGAMSILGQDWSQYMQGESLVSYGYSLILVPICMLFKNASFAYKAAIILNGIIWVAAYICSVITGKKILKKCGPYVSIVGNFFVFLMPIYLSSKAIISPIALLILLFWISFNLVVQITKCYKKSSFIILAFLTIIIVWLEPTMIAVTMGTVLYLIVLVQKRKLEEEKLLKWILFVLVGIVIGNIIEQILLYHIFGGKEIVYNPGLQVLWERIIKNWTQYGVIGWIFSIGSKLFSCIINTMAVVFFFFPVIKKVIREKKESAETYLCLILIMTFLITSMYWMTDVSNTGDIYFNYGIMPVILGPVLLISMQELLYTKNYEKKVMLGVLFLFGLTLIVEYLFKTGGNIRDELCTGILSYIQKSTNNVVGTIYYCAVIVVTVILVFRFIINIHLRWGMINQIIVIMVCIGISFEGIKLSSDMTKECVINEQKKYSSFFQTSKIINAIKSSCYYLETGSHTDSKVAVLQMLSNDKEIQYVEQEEGHQEKLLKEQKEKGLSSLIMTSTDIEKWEEKLEGYRVVYVTPDYTLWANSIDIQDMVDKFTTTKEKKVEKIEGEGTSSYGNNVVLSPGTYVARYELKVKKYKDEKGIGKLVIQDNLGILQQYAIKPNEVKVGDRTVIEIPFTSEHVMDNVEFRISSAKGSKIKIYKVTYQKENSSYSIGMKYRDKLYELYQLIKETDKQLGNQGTIEFVESMHTDITSSLAYLESIFTGYQIKQSQSVEVISPETDYLIFDTSQRGYYRLLQNYSVLLMNDSYTLLSKNGSYQSKTVEKNQGFLYSDRYKLDIRAFYTPNENGNYNLLRSMKIESGVYDYICDVTLIENEKNKEVLGELDIVNYSTELGKVELNTSMFSKRKTIQCKIPFIVGRKANKLLAELKLEDGIRIKIIPRYIELKQEQYMLGQEEKTIGTISEIVNKSSNNARIAFLTTYAEKEEELYSFEYLQKLMPECSFESATYEDVIDKKSDLFIITQGYSTAYWKLVSKYTIISVAGKYMLWARSDGEYLLEALENGGIAYTQGRKISPYCIAKAQGKEYDGTVSNLLSGNYKIYLDIQVMDCKEEDILEVGMSRDKTSDEIKKEKEVLEEKGYTSEDIEKQIEKTYYTDTKSYNFMEFSEKEGLVTTTEMYCPKGTKNVEPMVYSWKGSKVNASITWIELIQ